MEFIKNYHYIIDKLPFFRVKDVRLVVSVSYYIDYNEYYDEVSYLEIGYILDSTTEIKKHRLLLKFHEVKSLSLSGFGGAFNQIMGFNITDMGDHKWDNEQRYYVHDYENDIMKFYCKSVEVLSIEEL
ncbi:hypothetical protein D3P09_06725 [Paenibacillus pinisoli]|uniref:Uncharacterized protein n=1 Tax=Paenibacillus pinisoli TaxID=1276110 RepID=A0A3A6PJU3_9BACL|nr:hypothetical protein [Paenibacillus pinisoli]RJX41647.1 hypothetical protein D3P09_06725 [Paenibacillus pinisoli]